MVHIPDFIKLQELAELKDALKVKSLNEELLDHLQSTILYLIRYAKKNDIPLPNLPVIERALRHADSIIYQLNLNNGSEQRKNQHYHPSDSTKELDMIVKIRMIIKETHISSEMKIGMIWEIVK